ncbi:MAG: IS481 family transposase, partial [Patescibacteria group bacterium]
MKNRKTERSTHQLWAEFRFGVVGALLSNPPEPGELRLRLKALSETEWTHPIDGQKFRVSLPTIERWYYASLKQEK